jgi:hypothetical protein
MKDVTAGGEFPAYRCPLRNSSAVSSSHCNLKHSSATKRDAQNIDISEYSSSNVKEGHLNVHHAAKTETFREERLF